MLKHGCEPRHDFNLRGVCGHAGALAGAGGFLHVGAVVGGLRDGGGPAVAAEAPAVVRALQRPVRRLYPALRQRRQPAAAMQVSSHSMLSGC